MAKTAQCSCGKLRVEAEGEPSVVLVCHCTECQRRTGSVFGVGTYYPKDKVVISGPSRIYVRAGGEGRKMHNHFCTECGTTLYWESDFLPGAIGIAVGGFLDPAYPPPIRSVWEENRHHWVQLGAEIPGHMHGSKSKPVR